MVCFFDFLFLTAVLSGISTAVGLGEGGGKICVCVCV